MTKKKEVSPKKFSIKEIAEGVLVGEVFDVVVEFKHNGKAESVDVRIKQLPFAITEPLYNRFQKGENVVSEWIALSLVDDNNDCYLTQEKVDMNFTQSLAANVFNRILGIDKAPTNSEGK